MGTKHLMRLYWETENWEGSGIEGDKIWRRLHYTRAFDWEQALTTFLKRIGQNWGLPHYEDHPDRYIISALIPYRKGKTYEIDVTRAVKKRLRELAEKRFLRKQRKES